MKSTKFWIAVIGAALVLSAAAAVWLWLSSGGTVARISQDGVCINTIDLSQVTEPYTFTVETEQGGYNLVSVEPGRICVAEASCPDKVCVRQSWISGGGTPIACLPNGLTIEIVKAADSGGVDAATR